MGIFVSGYSNYYDTEEEITGKFRELVANKLGLTGDEVIKVASQTQYSGGCETCAFEWDDFIITVEGEEVYRSQTYTSPFAELQEWLESDD